MSRRCLYTTLPRTPDNNHILRLFFLARRSHTKTGTAASPATPLTLASTASGPVSRPTTRPALNPQTVILKKPRPVITAAAAILWPKLSSKDPTGMHSLYLCSLKSESNCDIIGRLQEFLETEMMYVQDLAQVYTYITFMRESKEKEEPEIPMPEELRQGRDRMIFGNIESIYEWHRE